MADHVAVERIDLARFEDGVEAGHSQADPRGGKRSCSDAGLDVQEDAAIAADGVEVGMLDRAAVGLGGGWFGGRLGRARLAEAAGLSMLSAASEAKRMVPLMVTARELVSTICCWVWTLLPRPRHESMPGAPDGAAVSSRAVSTGPAGPPAARSIVLSGSTDRSYQEASTPRLKTSSKRLAAPTWIRRPCLST